MRDRAFCIQFQNAVGEVVPFAVSVVVLPPTFMHLLELFLQCEKVVGFVGCRHNLSAGLGFRRNYYGRMQCAGNSDESADRNRPAECCDQPRVHQSSICNEVIQSATQTRSYLIGRRYPNHLRVDLFNVRLPAKSLIVSSATLLLMLSVTTLCDAQSKNGFDVSGALIDDAEILAGGPPRDGIPSIDHPKFLAVPDVGYLEDDDIVVGVKGRSTARAYPLRILIWHEIVNDVIDGEAIAVTYCPLCGTAMVFSRRYDGRQRTFGVSGLLYRSDVLMYDRETESLWSQLAMKAITGPAAGTPLRWLSSEHMTWKAWRDRYPDGRVLSTDTGFSRDYGGQAYEAYFASDQTMFPVPHKRRELKNKAWVLGIVVDGVAKAYPIDNLPDGVDVKDAIGDTSVVIRFDAGQRYPVVRGADGTEVPSVMVFWFAWQAFYPETLLWNARGDGN